MTEKEKEDDVIPRPSGERRAKTDRRSSGPRRTVRDRRRAQRRVRRVPVSKDRRSLRDRRRQQRRSGLDRRGRVARRLADRKRHTPAAYSPEQTSRLRKLISAGRTIVACPQCGDELMLDPPVTIRGTAVWEVHCPACFRSAMITDVTTANIVIVDDDAIVRDTLNVVLTRAGHRVREFGDAESAMLSYQEDPADLVLVDIVMPGMGGIEFIRRLHRQFPGAKVIAMSGQRRHGAPDPLATAKGLGATQSLRKPFSAPELLQVVDQVLGVRPGRSRS